MISVSKFSKLVAGAAALAVAAATFTSVPALAGPPVTPTFTVTNDATSQPLTDFVATEGSPVDETYTLNFDNSGWVFGTPGYGYGFGVGGFQNNGQGIGINAAVTLSSDKKTFALHISGTPTTGWYEAGTILIRDDNGMQYTYQFKVKIAPATPTPHIVVNGTEHTFGDVANLNTSGLFSSMPQLYLDRKDSSPLIPISNPNDLYSTTEISGGTTTITFSSSVLYSDPTYGDVTAYVIITLTDGVISYSVTTNSADLEREVAAGDIVLKSTLVVGDYAAANTLDGGSVSVFNRGAPYSVFDSESNSFDTVSGIETSVSASSDTNHLFRISIYDYTGCPTIAELDGAKADDLLATTTVYESSSSCAAPTVPDAVIDLAATSSAYNTVNLDWTIPSDGYSPITSYLVYQDGELVATIDSTSMSWPQNGATMVSIQVAGLTKSTTYNFKVVAVNDMGQSAEATDSATTPDKSFSAGTVPSGVVGKTYSQPVKIEWGGFTGNQILTITATDGMPAGLTFNGECSEGCSYSVAGTPTKAGTYNVTLTLAMADLSSITTTLTIVIYPAEAVIRPVDKTTSVSRVVSFGGDSSMLSVAAKASLRKLASLAKTKKITSVTVTGYTLKTTAAKQSWRSNLGLARAKAIAKYLKTLNPKLRIKLSGKGLVNKGRIATVKLMG